MGGFDQFFKQTTDELHVSTINYKFVGNVIITPHCLSEMLYYFSEIALKDDALICKKYSRYQSRRQIWGRASYLGFIPMKWLSREINTIETHEDIVI
ncbi:MAG: hypothetical protein JEZ08_01725 [Clostridiales bacterium]|nr:hypothetical protein [Clostridiales bacterium]